MGYALWLDATMARVGLPAGLQSAGTWYYTKNSGDSHGRTYFGGAAVLYAYYLLHIKFSLN